MNEIDSLLKRADRYLVTAEVLIRETDFESSVSRSYYAMFFAAQAALLSLSLSFSSHKMTISAFGEHFIKSEIFSKEMGKDFHKAFDRRQISDYNHDFIIDKSEAEEFLKCGKDFVGKIKKYLSN
ncbi:MAG: HEPN domain-containing protein [Ignavibacteriaceae bacterium]|nr:HEPN domain-containing protein [Ignavibacteriaceae bacterium]